MRPLLRLVVVVLLVGVLVAAGLATALLWFPAPLLRAGLRAAGFETAAFEDLRLGPRSLELSDLRLGAPPDHRLSRLQIRYRLGDLLRGRVESVEIEGLELRGRIVDGRVELAGFEGSGEPGAGAGLDVLPWPREVVLRAAEVQLATPWGELRLPLTAELRPGATATFHVEVSDGRLVNDAGRLRVELRLRGEAPLRRAVTLADIVASGTATVAAESFAVPRLAEGIDGRGEVAFELAGARLEVRLAPAGLALAVLGPQLAALAEPLPPPWRLRVGEAERPFRVTADLAREPVAVGVDGALHLAAGAARLDTTLAGSIGIDERGGVADVAGRARVTLADLRWQEATLARGELELRGEGTPARWQGTVDLELAGEGQPTADVALEGALLRQRLSAAFAERQLTLVAREPGALTVEGARWAQRASAGPLAWRLEPAGAPLLAVSFAADGGVVWQHHLEAHGESFDLTIGAAPALAARAEVAELGLALSGAADGLHAGQVAVAGGRLRLPDLQLNLEGIRTEVALSAEGLATDEAIPLAVGTISHGGSPAWFAPLALSATLRPGTEAIAFEARLERPADGFALTIEGRHDLGAGRGQAELGTAPLTFAPGVRQPGPLSPLLGEVLEDVSGTLALDGTLAWGAAEKVDADLALLVEDLAFSAGPARFAKVNGVIRVDQLWPLTTPPGQQLAIGLLDLGLPLTRGVIAFQLRPDQTLAVERLRWDFAGGRVSAAPFRVGSATSDMIVTLTAEGLDLAELFALTRLDGLSGEGTIGGTLPVRISGSAAVIEGGELRATGPGWLRYRPAEAPAALEAGGENVGLLLQALENFRYEALRITLDGRTDAEMDIGLHVQGANPDLYDGYPIEFNLDLEGELANILRSGLASYQIPERIREQMQGFRR